MSGMTQRRKDYYVNLLREAYLHQSIIPDVVRTRWYDESSDSRREFSKIAYRLRTEEDWFTDESVSADLVFTEMGRKIALSEEKEFFSILPPAESGDEFQGGRMYDQITSAVEILRKRGFSPRILLLPIDGYVDFFNWATTRQLPLRRMGNHDALQLDTITDLAIYWSNKFARLDIAALLDPDFGEWVVKPWGDVKSRVQVLLDPGQELIAQTLFSAKIVDRRGVVRFNVLPQRRAPDYSSFLSRFQDVERASVELLHERRIDAATSDPSTLVKELGELESSLGRDMAELVEIRNSVVHKPTEIPPGSVQRGVELSEALLSRMRGSRSGFLGPVREIASTSLDQVVAGIPIVTSEASALALALAERARDDISSCRENYRRRRFANAAQDLQQAVEKAAKSFGLLTGTVKPTSAEMRAVGHDSFKAFILHFWDFYPKLVAVTVAEAEIPSSKLLDNVLLRSVARNLKLVTESLKKSIPPEDQLRSEIAELNSLDPAVMWKATLELDESNKWVHEAMLGIRQKVLITDSLQAIIGLGKTAISLVKVFDEETMAKTRLAAAVGKTGQKLFSLSLLTCWHLQAARYPPMGKYWDLNAYTEKKPFVRMMPTFVKVADQSIKSAIEASKMAMNLGKRR
jgi:hypothetical protein